MDGISFERVQRILWDGSPEEIRALETDRSGNPLAYSIGDDSIEIRYGSWVSRGCGGLAYAPSCVAVLGRSHAFGPPRTTFEIVKDAIDEMNPYCLLPDAPGDEFDGESHEIANGITSLVSAREISRIISRVLTRSFGEEFSPEECMPTAGRIDNDLWVEMVREGLR